MKPFLKWAGNKYRIIDKIKELLPPGKRLIEPFTGSAAVFLNTNYDHYLLTDINSDLINLFQVLKEEQNQFIQYAKRYFDGKYNNEKAFYRLRNIFNETKDKRIKSAIFLYLNKHSFNGLCRYNASGQFNAPFGRYTFPYFPEEEMLCFADKAQRAVFECADFIKTMNSAKPGDVIYCDPPYVPLSTTANFTGYSTGGFNLEQQVILSKLAEKLARRGIPVIISNHDNAYVQKIYSNAEIKTFEVQRYISCNGNNRSKAPELLALFA